MNTRITRIPAMIKRKMESGTILSAVDAEVDAEVDAGAAGAAP